MSVARGSARFQRGRRLRSVLRISILDGVVFSIMVGLGETYFPALVAKLGHGQVAVGLVATVPMVAGALLQLATPALIRRARSNRRWVTLCTGTQALSLLILASGLLLGRPPLWFIFAAATLYWAAGLASAPAWTDWMGREIPPPVRGRYHARRSRWCQAGVLVGLLAGGFTLERFAGGVIGDAAAPRGLHAFAALFLTASLCRAISTGMLLFQPEHAPGRPAHAPTLTRRELAARLRHGPEGRLLAYLFALQAAANLAQPFFNPYMLAQARIDYARYTILLSAAFAAKVAVFPLLGRAANRLGVPRLLAMAGLGLVPLPLMWLWAHDFWSLLAAQLLSGCVWGAYELASFLMFYRAIHEDERTSILSVFNFGNAASIAAGSLIGGWLLALGSSHQPGGVDPRGYAAAFICSTVARAATLALLYRFITSPERVTPEPGPRVWPRVSLEPVAVRPAAGSVDHADLDAADDPRRHESRGVITPSPRAFDGKV